MPSRRDVLALLAAAPFAGCSADGATNDTPALSLSGLTVHVVGDAPFAADTDANRSSTVADADVVLATPSPSHDDTALYALARGTPVVVAGADAPKQVQRLCDRAGGTYGLPSESWTPRERAAAVVPAENRLDVQYVEPASETDLATQLPWVLGTVLDGDPPDLSVSKPPRPDGGVVLGRTRVRGRVAAGTYDRWDRVTLLPERTRAVVETAATMDTLGASTADRFRPSRVTVETAFEGASVEATGPRSAASETLTVEETVTKGTAEVTHSFATDGSGSGGSLTVGTRTLVSLADLAPPFAYVGDVGFEWRTDPLLGGGDSRVAHAAGRAVWDGF